MANVIACIDEHVHVHPCDDPGVKRHVGPGPPAVACRATAEAISAVAGDGQRELFIVAGRQVACRAAQSAARLI